MRPLRYTLLCDGPTDRALLPVINWALSRSIRERTFVDQLADFRAIPSPPRDLRERIANAIVDFPCDLLFIHRDAEREPMEKRIAEIEVAAGATVGNEFVPIVPVKMTEAWLLIDVAAIRLAADNPNGRTALELPSLEELEGLKNPKRLLREFLLAASEKSGRRKRQFERDLTRRMVRVSEYIDDFTPLRGLSAFRSFEAAASQAVRRFV